MDGGACAGLLLHLRNALHCYYPVAGKRLDHAEGNLLGRFLALLGACHFQRAGGAVFLHEAVCSTPSSLIGGIQDID